MFNMKYVFNTPVSRLAPKYTGIILRIIGNNFYKNNSRIIGCAQA